ncbi:hypothetical protein FOCC_FOCC006639 [Frankliniella occidentalis]|nr:hypothetical protein FOCC_FOCC006639 [Frankliniella occidentalis]
MRRAQRSQQLLQQPAGQPGVHGEHDARGAAHGAGRRGQPARDAAASRSRAAHVGSSSHDVPAQPASFVQDEALRGDERARRPAPVQQPRPAGAVGGAGPLRRGSRPPTPTTPSRRRRSSRS